MLTGACSVLVSALAAHHSAAFGFGFQGLAPQSFYAAKAGAWRSRGPLTMLKEIGHQNGGSTIPESDQKSTTAAVPEMLVPTVPVQAFDYVWRGPTLEPVAPPTAETEVPLAPKSQPMKPAPKRAAVQDRRAGASQAPSGSEPKRLSADRVPNIWLPIAHSGEVKAGASPHKVMVDGVPIALFRDLEGQIKAISDVCIHRGASLSTGWTQHGRVVCPYHGFEFEGDGRLAHMPGAGNRDTEASRGASGCGGRRAPSYAVQEKGGWIHLFPDPERPGAQPEFAREPYTPVEALDPSFRAVEGAVEISGGIDACVENMLDLLHISYVHSFGNMNNPVPFDVRYEARMDDGEGGALPSSRVAFHYKSGPKSFSRTVGRSEEVVVTNEFHLPYTCVIRVFFGQSSIKTIMASAVPVGDGRTRLNWKLFRNFALTHPLDQGPLNMAGDWLFRKMMEITLQEDKEIIENLYPEYQKGFMSGKFDKQMLAYRRAINHFQETTAARAATVNHELVETSLQMELLSKISGTKRGTIVSPTERTAIMDIIRRLETTYHSPSAPGVGSALQADDTTSAATDSAAFAVTEEAAAVAAAAASSKAAAKPQAAAFDPAVEGAWHLEYISREDTASSDEESGFSSNANKDNSRAGDEQWVYAGPDSKTEQLRLQALKQPGSEKLMLDWNEKGRPLWADTEESVQIIDTKNGVLTNRAVYKGWLGLTTVVQLDAMLKPIEEKANRFMVQFKQAIVDIGGQQIKIPYFGNFSPVGWLETTYLNDHIRIARGNKGSIFVLTRKPLSGSGSSDSTTSSKAQAPPSSSTSQQ